MNTLRSALIVAMAVAAFASARNPSEQGELFNEEEDTLRHFRDSFRRPSDPSDVIPWQEVDFFYNRNDYSSTLARYKGKRVRMPNGIRRFTKQTLRDIVRMDY